MTQMAFIEHGIIKDIGADMPEYPETMMAMVPSEARLGWSWDGTTAAAPPAPPTLDLVGYAKILRDERENAGTIVAGLPIRTDRDTRSALLEAKAMTDLDPLWTTPWALSDGSFVNVDAAMLALIIPAVGDHRRAAFAAFEQVVVAIEDGTITTREETDAAFAAA